MPSKKLEYVLKHIKPINYESIKQAQELQNSFIKPQGSLGVLEDISIKIAGITGKPRNALDKKVIFLFGSDHGVYDEGVCSSPQNFTARLMKVYANQKFGGINILAEQAGAELKLFDLGIKYFSDMGVNINGKFLRKGSSNFLFRRAMKVSMVKNYINFGIDLVNEAKSDKINLIGVGEVGMANTTPATACIIALTQKFEAEMVGYGAGLDKQGYLRKTYTIFKGLLRHKKFTKEPLNIISCVGGPEIATMVGVFLGCAYFKIPVLVDGITSIAAALAAYKILPEVRDYLFLSNFSPEPSFKAAAEALNLEAPLNLKMRLGEGTGCAVMMKIIDDALAIINKMGNFFEGGLLEMPESVVVVDCQYDFIDGSLACGGADEAINNIIEYINKYHEAKIFYSADWHNPEHCSYSQNGGIWPVHCQAGTHGAEIHEKFYTEIKNPEQRPNEKNIYYKGTNNNLEEYSAFNAKNKAGRELNQDVSKKVVVCGIASEFCVRETVLALKNAGHEIELLSDCLAWVNETNHYRNLGDLQQLGVKII